MKNIGILIFGDPTRGGAIISETKFLADLYEKNNHCKFYIITVNPSVTKRVIRQRMTSYNFPHSIITVFNENDFYKLDFLSCIVTYPGHSNFFGGYLNDNIILMYKIISRVTKMNKVPVFIRINDSEIKVRDYRRMSEIRLDPEKTNPNSAFMKDPINVEKARKLLEWDKWDYNLIYWLGNGSKETYDWVVETLYDRETPIYRMGTRELFIKNTIYVSDDIFFLIRKNYNRFKYLTTDRYINKFCYIGFFDTVNIPRVKALTNIFKKNEYEIPIKIFGKGTEKLNKISNFDNIYIEEGYIEGDSEEYFNFLNSHLAYIFIGKGQSKSRYIGKTVYDAVVARIPVIVYRKCDIDKIVFTSEKFYFDDEKGLNDIFKLLQDEKIREEWIEEQYNDIMSRLPECNFYFDDYCIDKEEIANDLLYTLHEEKSVKLF